MADLDVADIHRCLTTLVKEARQIQAEIDRLKRLDAAFRREAAQRATQWQKLGVVTSGWNSGANQCSPERVAGFVVAPGSRKRFDEIIQKTDSDVLTIERLVCKPMYAELFDHWVVDKARARLDGTVLD